MLEDMNSEKPKLGWIGIGRMATRWRRGSRRPGRRHRVESHAGEGRPGRSTAPRSPTTLLTRRLRHRVRHGVDMGRRKGKSSPAPQACCRATSAEDGRRVLVDLARRLSRAARTAAQARVELLCGASVGQRESDQGRPAVVRLLGPKAAFDHALPVLKLIAPSASYVAKASWAIVKICHNVFLVW